ncbi:hypothetical protein P152DRAFT_476970 [Eremomyces bilateralis CBS 781.70]|uniref:Uncharacterized protein n=1 Tax=Eremomyces bilateralis CBS 781.70 TaxID=1392243 RepID=A0A6G1FSN4_9PEZI|nr:uncharacterized protein P152DRAFT_476970 [Eremomyces bilateralis CBS 781.70]KAF1808875.1 hypothetical protein P152DRAFT_476970 [Eremomyces bilateralis CBS 781.70]
MSDFQIMFDAVMAARKASAETNIDDPTLSADDITSGASSLPENIEAVAHDPSTNLPDASTRMNEQNDGKKKLEIEPGLSAFFDFEEASGDISNNEIAGDLRDFHTEWEIDWQNHPILGEDVPEEYTKLFAHIGKDANGEASQSNKSAQPEAELNNGQLTPPEHVNGDKPQSVHPSNEMQLDTVEVAAKKPGNPSTTGYTNCGTIQAVNRTTTRAAGEPTKSGISTQGSGFVPTRSLTNRTYQSDSDSEDEFFDRVDEIVDERAEELLEKERAENAQSIGEVARDDQINPTGKFKSAPALMDQSGMVSDSTIRINTVSDVSSLPGIAPYIRPPVGLQAYTSADNPLLQGAGCPPGTVHPNDLHILPDKQNSHLPVASHPPSTTKILMTVPTEKEKLELEDFLFACELQHNPSARRSDSRYVVVVGNEKPTLNAVDAPPGDQNNQPAEGSNTSACPVVGNQNNQFTEAPGASPHPVISNQNNQFTETPRASLHLVADNQNNQFTESPRASLRLVSDNQNNQRIAASNSSHLSTGEQTNQSIEVSNVYPEPICVDDESAAPEAAQPATSNQATQSTASTDSSSAASDQETTASEPSSPAAEKQDNSTGATDSDEPDTTTAEKTTTRHSGKFPQPVAAFEKPIKMSEACNPEQKVVIDKITEECKVHCNRMVMGEHRVNLIGFDQFVADGNVIAWTDREMKFVLDWFTRGAKVLEKMKKGTVETFKQVQGLFLLYGPMYGEGTHLDLFRDYSHLAGPMVKDYLDVIEKNRVIRAAVEEAINAGAKIDLALLLKPVPVLPHEVENLDSKALTYLTYSSVGYPTPGMQVDWEKLRVDLEQHKEKIPVLYKLVGVCKTLALNTPRIQYCIREMMESATYSYHSLWHSCFDKRSRVDFAERAQKFHARLFYVIYNWFNVRKNSKILEFLGTDILKHDLPTLFENLNNLDEYEKTMQARYNWRQHKVNEIDAAFQKEEAKTMPILGNYASLMDPVLERPTHVDPQQDDLLGRMGSSPQPHGAQFVVQSPAGPAPTNNRGSPTAGLPRVMPTTPSRTNTGARPATGPSRVMTASPAQTKRGPRPTAGPSRVLPATPSQINKGGRPIAGPSRVMSDGPTQVIIGQRPTAGPFDRITMPPELGAGSAQPATPPKIKRKYLVDGSVGQQTPPDTPTSSGAPENKRRRLDSEQPNVGYI